MKYVLGNGLIGLIAGKLLNRKIIPFGKSRFYSYSIPLADDVILYADDVASAINSSPFMIYNQKMSLGGKLFEPTDELRNAYLNKIRTANSAVGGSIKTVMALRTSCTELYESLNKDPQVYDVKIKGLGLGKMILNDDSIVAYDSLISTIPLYALLKLLGMDMSLESRDIYCCHVNSGDIDLEGASCVYVADEYVEFFKALMVKKFEYVLFSFVELDESIVGKYLRNFKIIQKTVIRRAMPIDVPPNLDDLERMNITCVGSCAQWDDAMDVSSCIRRILKIKR